jgi:hypothetical protein
MTTSLTAGSGPAGAVKPRASIELRLFAFWD